jgi:hypothetical protein
MMNIIYQRATRVLVWLQHKEGKVVRVALNAICRCVCVEQPPEARTKLVSYQWHDREVTAFDEEDSVDLEGATVEALKRIGSAPWFSRGWVIQEVALCKLACIYWGHAEIDFAWIGVAALVATRTARFNMTPLGSIPIRHCVFIYLMYGRIYHSGRVVSFFTLLLNTTGFTFSEAKDRVYGLLGMETLECDPANGQPFVDPDYNISTMECYRRTTAKLLVERKDLRVLSWTPHGAKLRKDWPSWVPVWNEKTSAIFADIGDECKSITAPTEITQETCDEQERITISGFRVDTVKSGVLQYFEFTANVDDYEEVGRIQAFLRLFEHSHSPEALACTFGNADKGKALDHNRITTLLSDYHDFMQWKPPPSEAAQTPTDGGAARFLVRFWTDRVSHVLFLTRSGMFGLGPTGMRADDVVVVLHGSSVPFVLRPAEDGLWRLVGECYIYDVNEGRAVREWKEQGGVSEMFCMY